MRKCLGQLRVRPWDVVCGLNGEHVILRAFQFAPLSKTEIPGAVRLEAMQVCPFGLDQATVDYQLLDLDKAPKEKQKKGTKKNSAPANVMGILSVAQNKAVQFKRSLAARAGARCRLMDIDGLALLNAVQRLGSDNEPDRTTADRTIAVLHVGHSCTTVAIGAPGVAPFVRDLAFAGQAIIESMAEQTELSRQKVTQALQVAQGLSSKNEMSDTFRVPLQKACKQMVGHVKETLRYYATQKFGPAPSSVLVSGGFAAVPGFVDNLDKGLNGVHVRLWDPLDQLEISTPLQTAPGSAFAVAVGLALRVL